MFLVVQFPRRVEALKVAGREVQTHPTPTGETPAATAPGNARKLLVRQLSVWELYVDLNLAIFWNIKAQNFRGILLSMVNIS